LFYGVIRKKVNCYDQQNVKKYRVLLKNKFEKLVHLIGFTIIKYNLFTFKVNLLLNCVTDRQRDRQTDFLSVQFISYIYIYIYITLRFVTRSKFSKQKLSKICPLVRSWRFKNYKYSY